MFFNKNPCPTLTSLGYPGYSASTAAFLYTLKNTDNISPRKLPLKNTSDGGKSAIGNLDTYLATYGGGNDLYIANNANQNSGSYSNLGYSYEPPPGYTKGETKTQNFLAGSRNFTPDDFEMFYKVQ